MRTYLTKVTVATAFSLLGSSISHKEAIAANLFIGRYGSFAPDINLVGFIPKSELAKQIANADNKNLNTSEQGKIEQQALITKIDALGSAEPWKEQIEKEYNSFDNEANDSSSNLEKTEQSSDLTGIANADRINQNIENRYDGLVETDGEKINLFQANQLSKELLTDEVLAVSTNNQTENILNDTSSVKNELNSKNLDTTNILPKSFTAGIILAIFGGGCIVLVPVLNALGLSKNRKFFGFLGNIFGKSQVPNDIVSLHNKTFKQVANLASKILRMDDEKFTNQEFILYLQLRNKIQQGAKERQPMCLSIKYLEVGIIAQSSFLQLEQTELRYRSRKQQDFYQFVTDSITDDIDRIVFRDRVKRKLAEVLPLIHTEEGRDALKAYLKEVDQISHYDLGLKLLSLFKKYQLADFTILRKVSDIVEQSTAESLLTDDNLKVVVLKNYDVLEKLAPIIEIDQEDMKPKFFTKVIQYLGLSRRHEKSFQEFQALIKVLKQWQKTSNSLKTIREEYFNSEYRLPKEFYKDIPGLNVYKKYEEYIKNHQ